MGDNRRKSSRFQPPLERTAEPAVLRIGGIKLPARVEDVSAGGFGLVLDGRHQIQLHTRAVLQFDGDVYDVHVVRVEVGRGRTSIGVELGQDLVRAEDLQAVRPRLRSLFPGLPGAIIRSMGWTGFVLALLFAIAIWTGKELILSARFPVPTVSGQTPDSARNAGPRIPAAPTVRPPRREFTEYSEAARELFGFHFQVLTDAEKLALRKLEFIAAAGNEALVEELELNDEQRELIGRLLEAGREKLGSLSQANALSDESLSTIQKLHEAVRSVLTERQRQRLENLLREARI